MTRFHTVLTIAIMMAAMTVLPVLSPAVAGDRHSDGAVTTRSVHKNSIERPRFLPRNRIERRETRRYQRPRDEMRRADERNRDRSDRDRRRGTRPFYGHGDLPSYVPGIGTYAGGISAYRERGNGVYIQIERDPQFARPTRLPRTKVITIAPGRNDASCSFEAGVCVVR